MGHIMCTTCWKKRITVLLYHTIKFHVMFWQHVQNERVSLLIWFTWVLVDSLITSKFQSNSASQLFNYNGSFFLGKEKFEHFLKVNYNESRYVFNKQICVCKECVFRVPFTVHMTISFLSFKTFEWKFIFPLRFLLLHAHPEHECITFFFILYFCNSMNGEVKLWWNSSAREFSELFPCWIKVSN